MSNIIEVKNLVKNYKDVHAVNDISFTVEEGSFFAFLGINAVEFARLTTKSIATVIMKKSFMTSFIISFKESFITIPHIPSFFFKVGTYCLEIIAVSPFTSFASKRLLTDGDTERILPIFSIIDFEHLKNFVPFKISSSSYSFCSVLLIFFLIW